ncbi:MAG: hypothetical protein DRO40_08390 [Thermoprotei archaeon]|nr:MAG: hypothetical protein DRO40_08390 [Thermoprotei archaeon]
MAKAIYVKYENEVLKPLEKLDLKKGEEPEVIIRKKLDTVLEKYTGIFGKANVEELREIEEALYS